MPKGVYDRTKTAAERAANKASKKTVQKVAGPQVTKAFVAKEAAPQEKIQSSYNSQSYESDASIANLRQHLATLVAARSALTASNVEHNPALVAELDKETSGVISSMSTWREKHFPVVVAPRNPVVPRQVTPEIEAAMNKAAAAVQGRALTPAVPPAPLPFTPQAVLEVQKQASQQG